MFRESYCTILLSEGSLKYLPQNSNTAKIVY